MLDVCGVAKPGVEACLRVPVLGLDGSAGGRPRSNSTRPGLVGSLFRASADLAASVTFPRSAAPLPAPPAAAEALAAWAEPSSAAFDASLQPIMRIDSRTEVKNLRFIPRIRGG